MTNYNLGFNDQLSNDDVEEMDMKPTMNLSTQPMLMSRQPDVEETQVQDKFLRLTTWVWEYYEAI